MLGFYRELTAPAPTSVTGVLDSAVELLKSKVKAKHAVVERRWDGDVQVTAVAGELRQVFANLLANSLDAIDEEGVIKLRVSQGVSFNSLPTAPVIDRGTQRRTGKASQSSFVRVTGPISPQSIEARFLRPPLARRPIHHLL